MKTKMTSRHQRPLPARPGSLTGSDPVSRVGPWGTALALWLGLMTIYQLPIIITVPKVKAQDQKTLAISPPVLELEVKPGGKIEEEVSLRNLSDRTLTVKAQVRDFVSGGELGEPKILSEEETSPYSLKSWVSTDQSVFTLGAKAQIKIKIAIATPSSAEPGGHYALVSFTQEEERTPAGVAVRPGVGVLLLLRVEGAIEEKGNIELFRPTKLLYTTRLTEYLLRFRNSGNVHLKPTGRVVVRNIFGQEVGNVALNEAGGNVLPQSIRRFTTQWQPTLALGRYSAQLILKIGQKEELVTTTPATFWVFPLREMGIAFLVLIIAVLLILQYNAMIAARASLAESRRAKRQR